MTIPGDSLANPRRTRHDANRHAPRACLGEIWESTGSVLPVEVTVDEVGRIVLPKTLRDRLRLSPGTKVDVSEYGDGLHVTPVSRTARLEERDGRLVAVADSPITDDDVLALIDSGRR